MNYFIHIIIMIEIYIMLSLSLNLLIGYSGLLSLCQAAFYGIGAYSISILMKNYHFGFVFGVISTIFLSIVISFFISLIALRFRGDFFVLVTLGLQVILFTIFNNWVSLTKGPYGIVDIPHPIIFGIRVSSIYDFLIFCTILMIIIIGVLIPIFNSPYGLSLKTLRDDEISAQSLGKAPFKTFSLAFVISSTIATIPGIFYALYLNYIDTSSFSLDESIFQFSILLIGGSGNIKGPIIGAIFMVMFPEILRFAGLPDSIAPNLRQIIYGIILLLIIFFRPNGIAGKYNVF